MSVEIRTLEKERVEGGTVTIDGSFLNSGYVRKMYTTDPERFIRIPPVPHAHDFGEYFVLVSGVAKLVHKDSSGNLRARDLEQGKSYYVPADIPHQAIVNDGIVEVFFPKFDPSTARIEKFSEQFV